MKEKIQNKYIAWGLTIFCSLAALVLLFFILYRGHNIMKFVITIFNILKPFVYGLVIAYLMNPLVLFFDKNVYMVLLDNVIKSPKNQDKKIKISRFLSLFTSTFVFVAVLITCFNFIIPEILSSIETLFSNINTYLSNSRELLIKIFGGSESAREFINDNYGLITDYLNTWLNSGALDNIVTILGNGIVGTLKFVYNVVIGYVISIYMLFDKEKFKAQIKKILYTFFSNDRVNLILENVRYTDSIFGNFFVGKLIDSLIVGIICLVVMLILDMPYALIISVIVGVTNIIPYFGPFIGAIPSALLLLIVNPTKAIIFLIFIFILQQIDGNIIGPKILGSKIGLSSFWVLFSLLIFGGLFGVVGMIIGVPIFSILYSFINGLIKRRLSQKHLPEDSKAYENLAYINEKTGKLIYNK